LLDKIVQPETAARVTLEYGNVGKAPVAFVDTHHAPRHAKGERFFDRKAIAFSLGG
jgi:hypothetical protein